MKKILTWLSAVILSASLCLTGCGQSASSQESGDGQEVTIYYLNKGATAIQEADYTPQSDPDDAQDMIRELLKQLSTAPDDVSMRQPIRGFRVNKVSSLTKDGTVTVDFTGGYSDMDTVTEILTRTAIVYTLSEVKDVKHIEFTVDGKALKGADGKTIGKMDRKEFIYNSGTEMMNYVRARLHLYFTDESGKVLKDAYRSVVYNSNMAMERLVVEQLIAGPNNNNSFSPTLNPSTEVISVTERDNICYVNLSSAVQKGLEGVTPEVAVYSIVDSLTDLPDITEVQILVDGDPDVLFQDTIPLSEGFRRNTDLLSSNE